MATQAEKSSTTSSKLPRLMSLYLDFKKKECFVFSQILFLKLLAIAYLCAFGSLFIQIPGLYGADGLLPVKRFLRRVYAMQGSNRMNSLPTIFWFTDTILAYLPLPSSLSSFNSHENLLHVICLVNILLCLAILITRNYLLSFFSYFFLWASYLSIFQIGQTFLSFQWDVLLVEVGFISIFYCPARSKKGVYMSDEISIAIRELIKWLFFRFMFSSGVVKLLSGCPTWWSLASLQWHFESQPLPTPLARYAHFLPEVLLKFGVVQTFIFEIFLPILFYAPSRRLRIFSSIAQILLQINIILTGNYNFFNFLTIVLSISLFDDAFLLQYTPRPFLWLTGINKYDRRPVDEARKIQSTFAYELTSLLLCTLIVVVATLIYFPLDMMVEGKVNFDMEYVRDKVINSYILTYCVCMAIIVYFYECTKHILSTDEQPQQISSSKKKMRLGLKLFKFVFATAFGGYVFLATLHPFYSSIEANVENTFINKNLINFSYESSKSFHITSGYGLFRRMTGVGGRPEIIIEGSNDKKEWKAYEFIYKPGNLTRRDKWVAPHQPRLDWQMWFAALSDIRYQDWLINLLGRIFAKSESVLALLESNPFPDDPPVYLRIRKYKYHFEKLGASSGNWWRRDSEGTYLQEIQKENLAHVIDQMEFQPINRSIYPVNPMQQIPVLNIIITVLLINTLCTAISLKKYERTL